MTGTSSSKGCITLFRSTIAALMIIGAAPAYASDPAWSQFLGGKPAAACRGLAARLSECRDAVCRKALVPASSVVAELILRVDRGDTCATNVAFLVRPLLSGGDLEDVMRSLGELSAHHPALLLRMIKRHSLAEPQVASLLRMLPLSSVDDPQRKALIVDQRIASLRRVRCLRLRAERTMALAILEEYRRELE
jgi:hypothetical protein